MYRYDHTSNRICIVYDINYYTILSNINESSLRRYKKLMTLIRNQPQVCGGLGNYLEINELFIRLFYSLKKLIVQRWYVLRFRTAICKELDYPP